MKTKKPPFIDIGQVQKEIEEDERGITVENGCVVMRWKQGPEYAVDLKRVKDWAQLTDWMLHLCGKGWITPDRLRMFAEKVIGEKKWSRSCA